MGLFDLFKNNEEEDNKEKTMEDYLEQDKQYMDDIQDYYQRKGLTEGGLHAMSFIQNTTARPPETPDSAFLQAPEFKFNRDDMMRDIAERTGSSYSTSRDIAMKYGMPRMGLGAVANTLSAEDKAMGNLAKLETDIINKQAASTADVANKNAMAQEMNQWKTGQVIAEDNRMRSQLASQALSNVTGSLFGAEGAMLEQENKANYFEQVQDLIRKGYSTAQINAILRGGGGNFEEDASNTTTDVTE